MKTGENSASLQGQILASLSALHRTMEDYDSMARREMMKAKQEKAQMRLQKFRSDYNELRLQFEGLKSERDTAQRSELFASAAPTSATAARQRFSNTPNHASTSAELISESPFRSSTPNGVAPTTSLDREGFALREHSFIQDTETKLDDFIAQGREVLDNLMDQRNVLKGTQRRLLDAANTLGLSRDVIGWIERRSTQDMYIFFAGAIFTFFCFYLIWHYLG